MGLSTASLLRKFSLYAFRQFSLKASSPNCGVYLYVPVGK